MASAFVILLHSGHGPAHYDLMLEQAEGLATWQVAQDPAALPAGGWLPARRLADHRKAYLAYEGPVSGGRGSVQRTHAGFCLFLHQEDTRLRVRLEGPTCAGTFELRKEGEGGDWVIARLE